jgi:hypothetical protein
MKRILMGAAIAAIVVAFGVSAALAANSTAYMDQCKANIKNDPPPPSGAPMMSPETRLAFCQCIADTGDQAVIDEGLAMSKLPPPERFAKYSSASDKYKAAIDLCRKKLNLPAPPAPPTGSAKP